MMINRQEWLVDGYMSLIERDTPLTVEEGQQLRVDDIIKIAKWREIKVAVGVWCDMQISGVYNPPRAVHNPPRAVYSPPRSVYSPPPRGAYSPPRPVSPLQTSATRFATSGTSAPHMFGSYETHSQNVGREAPATIRPYIREQAYNREAVRLGVQNDLYPSHGHIAAHQPVIVMVPDM